MRSDRILALVITGILLIAVIFGVAVGTAYKLGETRGYIEGHQRGHSYGLKTLERISKINKEAGHWESHGWVEGSR